MDKTKEKLDEIVVSPVKEGERNIILVDENKAENEVILESEVIPQVNEPKPIVVSGDIVYKKVWCYNTSKYYEIHIGDDALIMYTLPKDGTGLEIPYTKLGRVINKNNIYDFNSRLSKWTFKKFFLGYAAIIFFIGSILYPSYIPYFTLPAVIYFGFVHWLYEKKKYDLSFFIVDNNELHRIILKFSSVGTKNKFASDLKKHESYSNHYKSYFLPKTDNDGKIYSRLEDFLKKGKKGVVLKKDGEV